MRISELHSFPVFGPVPFSFVSVHKHWGFRGWTTLKFALCKVHVSFDVGCECLGTGFLKAIIQPWGTNSSMDLHKQIIIEEDFLFIHLLSREILVLLMKGFTNSKFKAKASSGAEEALSRRKQTLSCASVRCKIQVQTLSFWKLCIPLWTSEKWACIVAIWWARVSPAPAFAGEPGGCAGCSRAPPGETWLRPPGWSPALRRERGFKNRSLKWRDQNSFLTRGFWGLWGVWFFKKKNWVAHCSSF